MQHLTIRIVTAILTFGIGLTAAAIWFTYCRPAPPAVDTSTIRSAPPDAPVAVCNLLQNTDGYDSKVVRVQAILVGYHELALYDPSCNKEKYLPVKFDSATRQKLISAIDNLNGSGFQRGNFWANIVLVGRFEKTQDEDRKTETNESEMMNRDYVKSDFQLVVFDVKQVEAVAANISWPQ